MDNKFGKISRISACAALKDGRTILEDLSFTAPYKIMMPFEKENGGSQIMPLCASAGIMAGDSQEFSYHVKEGADRVTCSWRKRNPFRMAWQRKIRWRLIERLGNTSDRPIFAVVSGGKGNSYRMQAEINSCRRCRRLCGIKFNILK